MTGVSLKKTYGEMLAEGQLLSGANKHFPHEFIPKSEMKQFEGGMIGGQYRKAHVNIGTRWLSVATVKVGQADGFLATHPETSPWRWTQEG